MDELNSQGRADPELWTGPLTRPRTLQGLIDSAQPYLKPLPTVAKPLRDEARTIVSATGGMKEALGKPRVDLVPSELILGAARALTFGVEKYDAHNWRKGIKGSLLYAALQRHL